jgi:hypothetical protein
MKFTILIAILLFSQFVLASSTTAPAWYKTPPASWSLTECQTWLNDPNNGKMSDLRYHVVFRQHQFLMTSRDYSTAIAFEKAECDKVVQSVSEASSPNADSLTMGSETTTDVFRKLLSVLSHSELKSGKSVQDTLAVIKPFETTFTLRDSDGEFNYDMATADIIAASGDLPSAEAAYRALFDTDQTHNASIYQTLSSLYPDAGKTQAILDEAVTKVGESSGGTWEAVVRKRTAYLLTQPNPDDAVIACLTRLPSDTKMGNLIDLAVAYAHKGNTAKFEETMQRLESYYPQALSTYRESGWPVWAAYYSKTNPSKAQQIVAQYFALRPLPNSSQIVSADHGNIDVGKLLADDGITPNDSINLFFYSAQDATDRLKIYLRKTTGQLNPDQIASVVNQFTLGTGTKILSVSPQSKSLGDSIAAVNTNHLPIAAFYSAMFEGEYPAACQIAFSNAKASSNDSDYVDWIKALSGAVRVNDQCYNGRALDVIKFANGTTNINPVSDLLGEQPASVKKR